MRAWMVLTVAIPLMAGCRDEFDVPPSTMAVEGWTPVTEPPLSPRYDAHAFWLGGRVVVMGGTDARPCPPTASCVLPNEMPFRDGAALDPRTGRWRPIAEAPVPLGLATSAAIGDTAYLWLTGTGWSPGAPAAFVAYDAGDDRWRQLPFPAGDPHEWPRLASAGDLIVAYQGTQESGVRPDLVFDPSTETWEELPPDPLIRSFDRGMVWTDAGLVLLGLEDVPQPGSEEPAVYRAAVLDLPTRTWSRLPDSEVIGYDPTWFWAGGLVVNASLGSGDGGEVNGWGRSYPNGGMLDPVRRRWFPLPDPPRPGPYPHVSLGGGDYVVSPNGWVLHVPSETWSELEPPPRTADEKQALMWTGERLFVWGGVRWRGMEAEIISDAWFWRP